MTAALMDSIRLAMVVPSLRGGGLERVVRDLALRLDKRRFRVELFCVDGLGVYADDLLREGIRVWDCCESGLRIRGLPLRLIRNLARFRPHIIHSHSGTWYPSAVARKVLRAPRLLFTDHGRYPPETRTRARIERWCASQTNKIVTVSNPLAHYVAEFLDLKTFPSVIANGIDIQNYSGADGRTRQRIRNEWGVKDEHFVVICVGRFVPVKNQMSLIRVTSALANEIPNLRLILVGTGPLEANLREEAENRAILDRIGFLGFRSDIAACLQGADCYALPSTTEGLPLSLLEAMAAGLPVVASAVGGIPEAMADPPCGILFPSGNVELVVDALRRLAKDASFRRLCAERARARASAFSLELMADQYGSVYHSILTHDGP